MEFLLRRQLDRFCGEKHGSEREEENGRNDFFHGVDNPSGCFGNAVSWSKDSMNIPKIKAVPAAGPEFAGTADAADTIFRAAKQELPCGIFEEGSSVCFHINL